ncbi:uncharacterized protein METZ01_LOCUS314878, partial [marine metagenome]
METAEILSIHLAYRDQLEREADAVRFLSLIGIVVDIIETIDGVKLGSMAAMGMMGVGRRILMQTADLAFLGYRADGVNIVEIGLALEHLRALRTIPMEASTASTFGGVWDWATIHLESIVSSTRVQAIEQWNDLPASMRGNMEYDSFISTFIKNELRTSCVIGQASHCGTAGSLTGRILSIQLTATPSQLQGELGRLLGDTGEIMAASIMNSFRPIIRAPDGTILSASIFAEGDPHGLGAFWLTFSGSKAKGFPDAQTFGEAGDLWLTRLGVPTVNAGDKVVLTQIKAGSSLSADDLDGIAELWWRSHQLSSVQTSFPSLGGGGLRSFSPVLFCTSP